MFHEEILANKLQVKISNLQQNESEFLFLSHKLERLYEKRDPFRLSIFINEHRDWFLEELLIIDDQPLYQASVEEEPEEENPKVSKKKNKKKKKK